MKAIRYILFGLLVAIVLGACQPPPAPVAAPTADPAIATLIAEAQQVAANKAVMEKFLALFGTGAWDEFDQVIATDCVLHYPGGVDVVGLDAMIAGWQEFFPKLKDLKFTTQGEVSEGNLLMEFITFEATYEGDYMGREITGVPIKYNQVEMQRIDDGKIVEWWVENDRLWMAEQLGMELVPAEQTAELNRLTVTFDDDQCVYHGQETMPAGTIWISLDVGDQTAYDAYGLVAYTLDEGKALGDLIAAPFVTGIPLWAHEQGYIEEVAPGTSKETHFMLVDGPLYLVCFLRKGPDDVEKANVLGPIEVEPF